MNEGLLDLPGMTIHYHEAGARGGVVLLIHGWASSGRMWRGVMEALSPVHRCLAFDLPGHGHSNKPDLAWYSLPNFVSVTHDFARLMEACPATLIGHSLGGTIALEYALSCPRDVERLVLVNPVVTGHLHLNLHWLYRRLPGRTAMTLARHLWPHLATRLKRSLAHNRLRFVPEGYVRRNLEDLTLTTADSLLGTARSARHDLSSRLPGLVVPTLVVIGSRDSTVPPDEGRKAAQRIPGAQLAELPADHHLADELPEAFFRLLQGFLGDAPRVEE